MDIKELESFAEKSITFNPGSIIHSGNCECGDSDGCDGDCGGDCSSDSTDESGPE